MKLICFRKLCDCGYIITTLYVKLISELQLIRYYTDIPSWTVCILFETKNAYRTAHLPNYRMSGHINLLTMQSVSIWSVSACSIFWPVCFLHSKSVSKNIVSARVFFPSHLRTYLGPLYQLKGVSATAEKRVMLICEK